MIELSKDLLQRAKNLLISERISDKEVIYLGYLTNQYIDEPNPILEAYLTQFCKFTENNIKEKNTLAHR